MKNLMFIMVAILSCDVAATSLIDSRAEVSADQTAAIDELYICLRKEANELESPASLELSSVCANEWDGVNAVLPGYKIELLKFSKETLLHEVLNYSKKQLSQ